MKYTSNATTRSPDEKRKLPRKLVRTGIKPWTPVSVLNSHHSDSSNWGTVVEKCVPPVTPEKLQIDRSEQSKKPVVCLESKENAKRKYLEQFNNNNNSNNNVQEKVKPPVFPRHDSMKLVRHGSFGGNFHENTKSSPPDVKFDINGNIINRKPISPQSKSFRHNRAEHPMAALFTKQMSLDRNITTPLPPKPQPLTPQSSPEYKIAKDDIVLHFNSPVVPKKHKDFEKENRNIMNTSLSEEEGRGLPLHAPIIEKDFHSPIHQGRKNILNLFEKNDAKEIKRSRTLDRSESKKKASWFSKSDHKLKMTMDANSGAPTQSTEQQKSKFKKQHRKSRSVMVQPTYLNENNNISNTSQEEIIPNKDITIAKDIPIPKTPKRKNSIGGSLKESKTEKLSIFKRIYGSPQTEKKLDINDLSLTKRSRRHTQPVGCIQKEFMRELKGKLDKYSSEDEVKKDNGCEKVVWNINI